MYITTLFLPFVSFLGSLLFGRLIGYKGAQLFTTVLVFISAVLSILIFWEVSLASSPCYIYLIDWMGFTAWGFTFDIITSIMLVVVTSVSALVHLYSIGYMNKDPHSARFMSYLSLFTFFMLILLTADNFIQMFVGWEGIGIASYLLINFWFTRIQANKSAMKAILVNRIGDFGFTLAILAIYFTFKSVHFDTVFSIAPYIVGDSFSIVGFSIDKLTFITLLLFIGAIGKSAQLGLHIWLPDAMEGPTPVSALIHAATMVTAGIVLIIRTAPLFELAPFTLIIVTVVGATTAFFAATTGLLQNDIKKVIAYSTCSQLGYMTFACGLSHYSASLFHLTNHAFFKALLFLSAGSIIHALNDEQDMRRMGGVIRLLPLTYSLILIGSLSLLGFPFLTGFYSKDLILEISYSNFNSYSIFAYWLGTISAFFTAFYSLRLLFLAFLNSPHSSRQIFVSSHESSVSMLLSMIFLATGSIFLGYWLKDMFVGFGTNFWLSDSYLSTFDSEFLPLFLKLLPVVFSIFGVVSALLLYFYFSSFLTSIKLLFNSFYAFFNKKWYFDKVYNDFIVKAFLDVSYNITFKLIDRGILEMIGPYGIVNVLRTLSIKLSSFHTGIIYHYAFLIILGLTIFLASLLFSWNTLYLLIAFITFILYYLI